MRILEVCVDLDGGGIDRYLYNYCSRISGIDFDFAIIDNNKVGILEAPIEKMGYRIFRVPRISSGVRRNYNVLRKIMTETIYDAIHVHLGYKSAIALLCAKNCGINIRIVHAHIAFAPETFKERLIRRMFTIFTKRLSTSLVACGIDAGIWSWGQKEYDKGRVNVQNNAIETLKYAYSDEKRRKSRNMLGINKDALVIGHVGRLSDQKNQIRLLDIFYYLHIQKPDSYLLLIGRGEKREDIEKKILELNLTDSVKLLGVRDDVSELLNAMDVFVFPSTYEGLPFTLIETQCNGLPAVCSDVITKHVKVTESLEFLSLDESDRNWSNIALDLSRRGHDLNAWQQVKAAGYDIEIQAQKLKDFYINSIKEAL